MSFRNFSLGSLTGSNRLTSIVFGVIDSERGGIEMLEELAIIIFGGLFDFVEREMYASFISSETILGTSRLLTAFSAVLNMVST